MKDAATIARADPEALYGAIADANEGAKFYKGKVGLRDVRRLVTAAGYVPSCSFAITICTLLTNL